MDLSKQAKEFRKAYEISNDPDKRSLQMKLITEEYHEVLDAHLKLNKYKGSESDCLKELADLVYVCFQYAENMEWPLLEALYRVHESNMSKLDENGKPIRREDGKILKGPHYKPPFLDDIFDSRFGFH